MSRPRTPPWQPPACPTSRVGYRTQGAALRALARVQQGNAQAAAPDAHDIRGVERCVHCGAWHLSVHEGVAR